MARGGARPNSGRKPRSVAVLDGRKTADRNWAQELIEKLNKPPEPNEPPDVAGWRLLWEAKDLRVMLDTRRYLHDHARGRAPQHIALDIGRNHLVELVNQFRKRYEQIQQNKRSRSTTGRG